MFEFAFFFFSWRFPSFLTIFSKQSCAPEVVVSVPRLCFEQQGRLHRERGSWRLWKFSSAQQLQVLSATGSVEDLWDLVRWQELSSSSCTSVLQLRYPSPPPKENESLLFPRLPRPQRAANSQPSSSETLPSQPSFLRISVATSTTALLSSGYRKPKNLVSTPPPRRPRQRYSVHLRTLQPKSKTKSIQNQAQNICTNNCITAQKVHKVDN